MYASNSHSYTRLILALGIVRKPTVRIFITSPSLGIHDIGLPSDMCCLIFCIDFMLLIMQICIFHVFDHADLEAGRLRRLEKQKLSVALQCC